MNFSICGLVKCHFLYFLIIIKINIKGILGLGLKWKYDVKLPTYLAGIFNFFGNISKEETLFAYYFFGNFRQFDLPHNKTYILTTSVSYCSEAESVPAKKWKLMVFYVPNICKNMKLDEKLLREIILGIHFVNVLLSWLYQMSSSS